MKKRNTIGMDMGDRKHNLCVLDAEGEILNRTTIAKTARGI